MTNEELNKWLADEIMVYPVCCSPIECVKYDIAKETAIKMQQRMIEKAVKWLSGRIYINQKVECNEDGQPYAKSYLDYCEKRLKAVEEITEDFKKAMEK